MGPPPARVARRRRGLGGQRSGPYVLTLIVYERERRALGSFLAPSARGAASCSSRRRPESLPAQLRPPGSPCSPPVTDGGLKGKGERRISQAACAEGRGRGMRVRASGLRGLPGRPVRPEPEPSAEFRPRSLRGPRGLAGALLGNG